MKFGGSRQQFNPSLFQNFDRGPDKRVDDVTDVGFKSRVRVTVEVRDRIRVRVGVRVWVRVRVRVTITVRF